MKRSTSLRVVIPKELANAKTPESGFVLKNQAQLDLHRPQSQPLQILD